MVADVKIEISRRKYNNIVENGENTSEICPRSLFGSSSEDHGYDCEAALLRILPKSSTKQKQQVFLVVQRAIAEQSLLPECPNFTQSLITDAPSWKLDTYSQNLLHKFCNGYSTHSPVIVSGDGNCLFNAISYLLSGNESLSTELRLRTVIELSCNTNFYLEHPHAVQFFKIADYDESIIDCARSGHCSSIWTIWALASVVGRNIVSIYLAVNGSDDISVRILNVTLEPHRLSVDAIELPMLLLWTKNEDGLSPWTSNHFSPVVSLISKTLIHHNVEESQNPKLVEAHKGGLRLLLNGYSYVRDKKSKKKLYWRCYLRSSCTGKLPTSHVDMVNAEQSVKILQQPSLHNHAPNICKVLRDFTVSSMRREVKDNPSCSVNAMYKSVVAKSAFLSKATRHLLPKYDSVRAILTRERSSISKPEKMVADFKIAAGTCALCYRDDDDKNRFGEKRSLDGVTVHNFCTLFASGLHQNGRDDNDGISGFLLQDIKKEASRAKRLKCIYCKEGGATIGCCETKCRASFHFPCGLENKVLNQYFGSFSSFCEKHRPEQKLRKKQFGSPTKVVSCSICLCSLDDVSRHEILHTPCCRNAQFHKECVQRQAQCSGLHFFKCPLCNNKEKFQDEMLKFGIFIPDRDAEWELEDDAYSELLVRHNRCDAKKCLCPMGRDSNTRDSVWELMLCDCCGSQGTHLRCSKLLTPQDDWMCHGCQEALKSAPTPDDLDTSGRANTSSSVDAHSAGQKRKRSSKKKSSSNTQGDIRRYLTFSGANSRPNNALADITASTSNVPRSPAPFVDNDKSDNEGIYKPGRRRLSRYIQLHKQVGGTAISPNKKPRWIKDLLSDDIHTGRNLGSKLAYMCSKAENQEISSNK